jgi:hypothetical protein
MEAAGCVLIITDPCCIDEPHMADRAASGIGTGNAMHRVVQHREKVVKRSLSSLYVTFGSPYAPPVFCEVYGYGDRRHLESCR